MLLEVMAMSHGLPRAPLSVQDQGLICFSLFPVASKGLPRCGAVWGHLKFQWFWSLAG